MRLHGHVRIQVVQSAIRFLTPVPATLVHTLNFFVTTARALMLLCTGNRNERVDLKHRVSSLIRSASNTHPTRANATRSTKKKKKKGCVTYLAGPRSGGCRGGSADGRSRCAVGTRHSMLVMGRGVTMRPLGTRIHLRRRVPLVLRHVMALRLRLVGRVRWRVSRTRGGDRRIYRHDRVRLHVRLIAVLPIDRGGRRTRGLSHSGRTAGLGIRRGWILRLTS